KSFVAQVGYVANRTVRQTNYVDLNAGQVPGQGNNGRPFFPNFRRTVTTALVDSLGHTKYDSLQTSLTRRFQNGFQFNMAYTFSKAIGICCNADNAGGPAIQALSFQRLNRAVSSFDRTHNLEVLWSYELPFGKGKPYANQGVGAMVLGGWQISGLLSAYSGAPFTVGADGASLNMPGNSQRADQVGPVRRLGNVGSGQAFYDWTSFKPVTDAR